MSTKVVDVNKGTIMDMLRTDVFGFKPQDIESQAKEVFHLVSGQEAVRDVKIVGGYVRTMGGFIILNRPLSQGSSQTDGSASGKKKKK